MAQSNAIKDREFRKFIESPTRDGGSAIEVSVSNKKDLYQGSIIAGIEYDAVTFSYPDGITEIVRYYSGGVSGQLVATITAIFETNSKKNLLSLVRT